MKNSISSNSRFIVGIVFLFALLTVSNSCKKTATDMTVTPSNTGGTGGQAANEVFIQGMSYSPSTLSVAVGTTVKWTNKDGVSHTVTSNTGAFDSGNISSNGTFSFTFSAAGTYSYYCAVHPSMTAKVIVN
jgi:plastocyanin